MATSYKLGVDGLYSLALFCLFGDVIDYYTQPVMGAGDLGRLSILIYISKITGHKSLFLVAVILVPAITASILQANDFLETFENMLFAMKIALFFICISLFQKPNIGIMHSRVKYIYMFLVIDIILTFLGLGEVQYGVHSSGLPLGSGGVYIGANELSIAFLFITLLGIGNLSVTMLLIGAVIGILLATKVALVGSSILFIVALYRLRFKSIILFPFVIYFQSQIIFVYSMFAERYQYYYRVSKNLLTLMLSGRDTRIESTLQSWVNSDFFDLIFGIGFVNVKNMSIIDIGFTENDLVDLTTIMGLPMTCFLLIALILPIYTFLGRKNFSSSIAVTCILSLSFISGHVFYNSILPVFLILIMKRQRSQS